MCLFMTGVTCVFVLLRTSAEFWLLGRVRHEAKWVKLTEKEKTVTVKRKC